MQHLTFDGTALFWSDYYEVQMDDVEVDSGGETEFKQQDKITVGYFDTETLTVKTAEIYVEGDKASLVKDTSIKGLWSVNFTLKEF